VRPKKTDSTIPERTERATSAREELRAWANARNLRDRAVKYQANARTAPDRNAEDRFKEIANHYRALAALEAQKANRLGSERRASTESGLGRELEIIRAQLRSFASKQKNTIVRLQCQALERALAKLSEESPSSNRQVLAEHIEQLEKAMRCPPNDAPLVE
jgi:hypothetical protein